MSAPHIQTAAKAEPVSRWHFIEGKWIAGNPRLMRAFDHATWLGGGVFDGARAFEGVAPDLDLHCQRVVRSAAFMGFRSPLSAGEIEEICRDGIARFPKGAELYIRPFLWSEDGWMAPDPASTRIVISVSLTPLPQPEGARVCLSRFRRPSPETAPTEAKAVCLYAQAGRASGEARARGYDDGVMLDPLGHVAELSSANLWIVKDGAAITPVPNGTFLNGITRQRLLRLFAQAGIPAYERSLDYRDVLEADEVFTSGNYGKVMPIVEVEGKEKPIGPIYRRARDLYWAFAHGDRRLAA